MFAAFQLINKYTHLLPRKAMDVPRLPPEVIRHILELSEPQAAARAAIALADEGVKKRVLPKLSLPRRWRSRDAEIITWLLRYQVGGTTPKALTKIAAWAARKGHLDVVRLLHKHGGARFFESDSDGFFSLMHVTANMGHVDVVRFLHENHLGGSCGEMTMQYAALAGHLDVMRFLYENRPESKCRVDDLMDLAAERGHVEVLRFLREKHPKDSTYSAMVTAARCDRLDAVRYLHENASKSCATEAMDEAAACGHLDVVRFLLNENRFNGRTTRAMERAARNGHLHVVRLLHDSGSFGCTMRAMDKATKNGHLDVVRFLHQKRSEDRGQRTSPRLPL